MQRHVDVLYCGHCDIINCPLDISSFGRRNFSQKLLIETGGLLHICVGELMTAACRPVLREQVQTRLGEMQGALCRPIFISACFFVPTALIADAEAWAWCAENSRKINLTPKCWMLTLPITWMSILGFNTPPYVCLQGAYWLDQRWHLRAAASSLSSMFCALLTTNLLLLILHT
jgi:hypothetical protein